MSLDAVPSNINMKQIESPLSDMPGLEKWHHWHVWAVSTTETAATVHAVIKDLKDMENVKQALKQALREKGIRHVTVECETKDCKCREESCC